MLEVFFNLLDNEDDDDVDLLFESSNESFEFSDALDDDLLGESPIFMILGQCCKHLVKNGFVTPITSPGLLLL